MPGSVCTTELGEAARLLPEFSRRNVRLLGLSCEPVESHLRWVEDIKAFNKLADVGFPIIADSDRSIATQFGMLDPELKDAAGMPLTVRSVFVINPARKVALTITYPASYVRAGGSAPRPSD